MGYALGTLRMFAVSPGWGKIYGAREYPPPPTSPREAEGIIGGDGVGGGRRSKEKQAAEADIHGNLAGLQSRRHGPRTEIGRQYAIDRVAVKIDGEALGGHPKLIGMLDENFGRDWRRNAQFG